MKKVLLSLFVVALGFGANAQNAGGLQFGLGVNAGLPVSGDWGPHKFSDVFPFQLGGDAAIKYSITDNFALTADAGYNNLFAKKTYTDYNYRIIPIRAGVRFYPTESIFLGAKAGVGLGQFQYTDGVNGKVERDYSMFSYGLGAGYVINNSFEVGLNYDGYSSKEDNLSNQIQNPQLGVINLRLGYWFGNK